MGRFRNAAVAGQFYPGDKDELESKVRNFVCGGKSFEQPPKALIVPHAGYIYSGLVAGRTYQTLIDHEDKIKNVVIFGPSHFVNFYGVATSSADAFLTPLGEVEVNKNAYKMVADLPYVTTNDAAHKREHSLEVQLPFLQALLERFAILPFATGSVSPGEISDIITRFSKNPDTLFIISSDLSHFHDYETAQSLDASTAESIENLEQISASQACGSTGINGVLLFARSHGLMCRTICLLNSADAGGPYHRVVGYGGFGFWEN